MYNNKKLGAGIILGSIGFIILWVVILPFLLFWLGYFNGWLAKLIVGDALIRGFNTLFNTTYFTKDMLPIIGGTLAWIGSFFHGIASTTSSSKN